MFHTFCTLLEQLLDHKVTNSKYSEVKLQMCSLNTIITHISIMCRPKTIVWHRISIHLHMFWYNYCEWMNELFDPKVTKWNYSEVKLQILSLNTIITHISIICRSKTIIWHRIFIHFAHYLHNYWTPRWQTRNVPRWNCKCFLWIQLSHIFP